MSVPAKLYKCYFECAGKTPLSLSGSYVNLNRKDLFHLRPFECQDDDLKVSPIHLTSVETLRSIMIKNICDINGDVSKMQCALKEIRNKKNKVQHLR